MWHRGICWAAVTFDRLWKGMTQRQTSNDIMALSSLIARSECLAIRRNRQFTEKLFAGRVRAQGDT